MNNTSKIMMIVIAVVLIGCCGGGFFMMSSLTGVVDERVTQASEKGKVYAEQILSDWSAKELVALSSNDYRKEFSEEDFQESLDGNEQALGEYVTGKGEAKLKSSGKDGTSIVVNYTHSATFEKGNAKVRMELVQEDNIWKVALFSVEPD